ncbi:alcohol dehydrogenase catalytic domain-containing protein [Actinoplanes sp. NPDC051411]|uniref:zinc-dependent alcohol dehydrogenase n=1 Tax=Actinoplanes sp. NPDC051411 TaxID=3155522 RepID=UPI003448E86C
MRFSHVTGPRSSEIVEAEIAPPGPGQVLVDVLACGVCTSDRTTWAARATSENPIRLGHEMVGRIAAVGDQHSGWAAGDVVTGLGGDGFATQALLDSQTILPVPAGLPPELCLGEPLAVLVEALGRSNVRPGDRVAIVGLGFMGQALVQLTRALLPSEIIGIDPSPYARERGLAAGCTQVLAPGEVPAEAIADVVLEASGADAALATSARLVRQHGTLSVIGYHHSGEARLDMDLWYKGVTVVNGFSPQRPRVIAAMRLGLREIADRQFSFAPLITHRFGLDGVDEAFRLMEAAPPEFVKSIIVP